MERNECSYSGEEIEPGTGILLVRNNGERLWFKDSKCLKNAELGRPARDVEWTEIEEEDAEE